MLSSSWAEDLDYLLTVHHLFNVAVDGGDIFLLRDKVAWRLKLRPFFGGKEHDADHHKCDKRQRDVEKRSY